MLSRFARERREDAAVVYCDDLQAGALQPLSGFPRSWRAADRQRLF
jgi:hypothetical protein